MVCCRDYTNNVIVKMIIFVSENVSGAFLETFGKVLNGTEGVSGKIRKKRMDLYRKQQEKT
jgi:hypothetical protein